MEKKEIKILIKKDGSFSLEAGEGFKGVNCREATRELELALGGTQVATENTDAFYDNDGDGDLGLNLDFTK